MARLQDAAPRGLAQALRTHATMRMNLGDTQEMEKANHRRHTPILFVQSWDLNNLELRGSMARLGREEMGSLDRARCPPP